METAMNLACTSSEIKTALFPLLLNDTSLTYPTNFSSFMFPSGPGSSVGIATDYGLDGLGSNPGWDEIFRPSTPALGPTQPPVKWVPDLSRGQSAAGACCFPLTPF